MFSKLVLSVAVPPVTVKVGAATAAALSNSAAAATGKDLKVLILLLGFLVIGPAEFSFSTEHKCADVQNPKQ
jgi:hypothetical protein